MRIVSDRDSYILAAARAKLYLGVPLTDEEWSVLAQHEKTCGTKKKTVDVSSYRMRRGRGV